MAYQSVKKFVADFKAAVKFANDDIDFSSLKNIDASFKAKFARLAAGGVYSIPFKMSDMPIERVAFNLEHPAFAYCSVALLLQFVEPFLFGLLLANRRVIAFKLSNWLLGPSILRSLPVSQGSLLAIAQIYFLLRFAGSHDPTWGLGPRTPMFVRNWPYMKYAMFTYICLLLGYCVATIVRISLNWLSESLLWIAFALFEISGVALSSHLIGSRVKESLVEAAFKFLRPYRRAATLQKDAGARFLFGKQAKSRYKYKPLKSVKCIRLLKMQAEGRSPYRVFCELIEVEHQSAPPYDAISYLWGDSELSQVLRLGNDFSEGIPITKNACRALTAAIPLESTRYVWMDSICINQKDGHEKNQQLPRMTEIYQYADGVLAYLGDRTNAGSAVNFANRAFLHHAWGKTIALGSLSRTQAQLKVPYKHPVSDDDPGLEPFRRLANNEYWMRMWIIQECIVARKITLYYGGYPLDWELFQNALRLYVLGSRWPADVDPPLSMQRMAQVTALWYERFMFTNYLEKPPIIDLVARYRYARCSNPEDQVHAMLNISSDCGLTSLRPRSQQSVRVVYTNLVIHALDTNRLDIFLFAGLSQPRKISDIKDLPSWVPDLSVPARPHLTSPYLRGYEAGTNIQLQYELADENYQLRWRGARSDEIRYCSYDPGFDHNTVGGKRGTPNLVWPLRLMYFMMRVYDIYNLAMKVLPKPSIEALWRTVAEDFDGEYHPSRTDLSSVVESCCKIAKMWEEVEVVDASADIPREEELELKGAWVKIKEYVSSSAALGEAWAIEMKQSFPLFSQAEVHQSAQKQIILLPKFQMLADGLIGKKFAVTRGGLLAKVPPGSRPGDVLAVFSGCPVLQVLRPFSSCPVPPSLRSVHHVDFSYALYGYAYVHGMMHGEGLRDELEWLVLR